MAANMEEGANGLMSRNIKITLNKRIAISDTDEESSNLCVAVNSDGNKVLVGSENGSFLLSLDDEKVITSYKSVEGKPINEVPSAIFSSDDENVIFIASDNYILLYDTRQSSAKPVCMFSENSDEINQLAVSRNHLAACDDSGEIKIYDFAAKKSFRTLRNKHKNICSTVCYRKTSGMELLSGSLDCQLILWDYSKIKVLNASNVQDIFRATDGDDSNYMFNPPLINTVDCSLDGECVVCGLGNGSIVLYDVTKGRKLRPFDILRTHSSIGTSCLKLFGYKDSRFLISGGNDCKVNVKEIPSDRKSTTESRNNAAFCSTEMSSKVNHLAVFAQNEKLFCLVCDQTNQLTLFKLDLSN